MLNFFRWHQKSRFFLLGLLIHLGLYQALAEPAEDSAVIAALALNFARFTEWPSNALKTNDTTVKLCVLADNVMQQAFDEIDKKPVGNRALEVIKMTRIRNMEQCHLLYVNNLDRNTAIQMLASITKKPILTMGSGEEHFLKDGGMVALNIVDGKVQIQIHLNAVKQSGLQINSRVLKLATIIDP